MHGNIHFYKYVYYWSILYPIIQFFSIVKDNSGIQNYNGARQKVLISIIKLESSSHHI